MVTQPLVGLKVGIGRHYSTLILLFYCYKSFLPMQICSILSSNTEVYLHSKFLQDLNQTWDLGGEE